MNTYSDLKMPTQIMTLEQVDQFIPYERRNLVPILPLNEIINVKFPYYEYALLAYFSDNNDFIPTVVLKKTIGIHHSLTCSGYSCFRERRKTLQRHNFIKITDEGCYINTSKCFWAPREVVKKLLFLKSDSDTLFTLYFAYTKQGEVFSLRQYSSMSGKTSYQGEKNNIKRLFSSLKFLKEAKIKIQLVEGYGERKVIYGNIQEAEKYSLWLEENERKKFLIARGTDWKWDKVEYLTEKI